MPHGSILDLTLEEHDPGVNLNVLAHLAKNPVNRKLKKEFDLQFKLFLKFSVCWIRILVASEHEEEGDKAGLNEKEEKTKVK